MINAKETSTALVRLAEERAKDPKWVWGLSWGEDFPTLDRKTHGIHDKKMMLLISRPAAGKSALAVKIALHVARGFRGTGKVVRFVTLEMSAESLQMRMGSLLANVPMSRIESGYATAEQRARFVKAQADLAALPIEYMESASDMEEIERFVGGDGKCGFWVLDHIGITPGISGAYSTYQALQKASIRVTNLCHKKVTGLVLGHQNRQGTQGDDKRPTHDSVAGADQISRDADLILGIFRPDMFVRLPEDESNNPKPAELLILKNRSGSTGTIYTIYSPTRTDWVEDKQANHLPDEDEQPPKKQGNKDAGAANGTTP